MEDTPLNVQHLHRLDNIQLLTEEQSFVSASQFELCIIPFTDHLPVLLKSTPSYPFTTFSLTYQDYYILKIAFVKTIKLKYSYSNIFSKPISTNKNLRVSFVNSIHGTFFFTSDDALKQIRLLHYQGVL